MNKMMHHNFRRAYYNASSIVLIVLLLVAGPVRVRSNPVTCPGETAELRTNSFSIVQQVEALDLWTNEQRSIPSNNICDTQSHLKTTCLMDYVNVTDSSDWCLSVPNTLYVETTLIYKCTNDKNNKNLFYSIKNRPACYSNACYEGYDKNVLESLERATFESLANEFENPNTDSEWGDVAGFDNCVELRLAVTDPILSEVVAVVEVDEATVPPTGSPTITSGPTDSSAPSQFPTLSFAPSTSLAPTVTPVVLDCKDESAQLVSSTSTISLQVQATQRSSDSITNPVAKGLANLQDLLNIDSDTGEGFEQYCKAIATDENVTAVCEFNYDDVIVLTADKKEDSVAALCHTANGVYVEDSVSITCTSVQDDASPTSATTTRLIFTNKPSCRSKMCNADGVREVATTEFDRWMKLTLEDGLDEAFAKLDEDIDDDGDGDLSILNGTQSCVIDANIDTDDDETDSDDSDDEEEGVVVAVGGSSLSNIGGEPIPPTDECQAFTDAVDGNIEVYNQRALFQREMIDYVTTDLREICGSPEPDVLACNFDWSEIFADEEDASDEEPSDANAKATADVDALKSVCMPDGTGSSGAGQYVESTFKVTCSNIVGKELTLTNTNVPGCVGRPCTSGQAEYLFSDGYTFLANHFILEGWDCTSEVLSVFAPHYDPFFGTYSMADIGSNPQFDVNDTVVDVVGDDEGSDVIVANEKNFSLVGPGDGTANPGNNIIVVDGPKTQAPTAESNIHLRGPKFENLFETPTPTPKNDNDEFAGASSSPGRFSNTITALLLLIPAALSVFIL